MIVQPFLYRGQPPAKGILHTEQRTPMKTRTGADGRPEQVADTRGYWLGQHTNKAKRAKREALKKFGARQVRKVIKEQRRG